MVRPGSAATAVAALLLARLVSPGGAINEASQKRLRAATVQPNASDGTRLFAPVGQGVVRVLAEGNSSHATVVGIAATGITFEPEPLDPDALARHNFAQRCQVILSVTDGREDLLPLDALRQFCESTDDSLACRIAVVSRLKQTYKRGTSIWDYCLNTYQWFQDRYGMHCPQQCRKTQCKATCEWLSIKKNVDMQGNNVKVLQLKLDAATSALENLNNSIEAAAQAKLDAERALEQAQTDEQRGIEKLDWATREQEAAQEKVVSREGGISNISSKQNELEEEIQHEEEHLREMQYEQDFSTQRYSQADAKKRKLGEKLTKKGDDISKIEEEEAQIRASIKQHEAEINNTELRLDDLREQLAWHTEEAEKWEEEEKQAEGLLNGSIDTGNRSEQYEDLVKQQNERLTASRDEVAVINRNIKRNLHLKESSESAISRANDALKKLDEKKTEKEGQVDEVMQELNDASDDYDQLGNSTSDQAKNIRKQQEALDELDAKLAKMGRTQTFEESVLSEEMGALEKANAETSKARRQLQLYEDNIVKRNQELEDKKEALQQLEDKWKIDSEAFAEDSQMLTQEIDDYKKARDDLLRTAPEIVTQHGLALLSFSAAKH